MTDYQSTFLRTLQERGYIYQVTDAAALDASLQAGPVTGYIGFDCTAPSLHVGSLVQIMMLRHLQKTGHRPIVLLGGGTTKVGDPTDKDKSRPILTEAQIEFNKAGIKRVFSKFLDFGEGGAILVDNDSWLSQLGYIEFLRDIGPHFTVNRMVALESVKRRLERESPMTFLEFNYSLLQAYDFLELNRRHGCTLQMGGSDQWGNIVGGADLVRRLADAKAFGLTTPLITTASGGKMGKTASGAVWLNADPALGEAFTRSPYEYWQFWRNTEDADVGRFLRLFTELPLSEIGRLEALEGAAINDAKTALADAATALLHGDAAARDAAATARSTFETGSGRGLPTFTVAPGTGVLDATVTAGLAASNGEARRHIKAGALKLNDERVDTHTKAIAEGDLRDGVAKLSVGKKRHALLKLE